MQNQLSTATPNVASLLASGYLMETPVPDPPPIDPPDNTGGGNVIDPPDNTGGGNLTGGDEEEEEESS